MSAERIESQLTVPASTACSVSNGAQTSAVTCTLTAGTYFPTTLVAHLQTLFNLNVNGYPRSASALASVIGGTWTAGAGWLCDESATPLVPAFGSPNLTAVSTPTYLNAGPAGGVDYAVGFDSALDAFSGGDVHNVGATDDLILAWVGKFPAIGNVDVMGKWPGGGIAGYSVFVENGSLLLYTFDGVDIIPATAAAPTAGSWYAAIACIDRSTAKQRIGYCVLGGSPTVSAEVSTTLLGNITNAGNFVLGATNVYGSSSTYSPLIAAAYVVVGSGVATGLSSNLSTAVQSFANAINSSFTVSLSTTTGLVSISNSYYPSYVTFDSTLRSTLGFAYDFDYPQTAAQMATALGYGTWTSGAGYLCNETSGNLASVFGTPATLTAVSTPTYGGQGARGGADLSVGFDSAADAFDGSSNFDVGVSDDLVVAWVGKFSSSQATLTPLLSKSNGAITAGWAVYSRTGNSDGVAIWAQVSGGSSYQAIAGLSALQLNKWHVGIAVIDRSTGMMRVGTRSIDGTTVVSTETAVTGSFASSGTFRLGASTWSLGDPYFQLASAYVVSGSGVATGLSSNLSTALSSFASYMKSQTGTQQAECLWIPGCPLNLDGGDPSVAPIGDDARATVSPDGNVYGVAETTFFHHRGLRFSHVAKSKVWANHATYVNADWETFYLDTQLGQHSWCTPFSRVKVYFDNAGTATELGGGDVTGWKMPSPTKLNQLRNAVDPWTGLVDVKLGDLFASE
jgi:hypothetical protein